jgi:mono/diheme cytochrome c family protein
MAVRTVKLVAPLIVLVVLTGLLGLVAVAQSRTAPPAAPTFARDVAPILFKHCTSCHRPGEIGPMPLLTYEDARAFRGEIKDNVLTGHMPPWHADPRYGRFLNERRLSEAEKAAIVRWADAGAPAGNLAEMPPAPVHPEGWTIGTPDAIVTMPTAFDVPAKGEIEYQYIEVPTNFTEDKWIQAVEIRPGARHVVHHVLVYSREPAPSTRPQVMRPRADLAIPPPPPRPDGQPRPRRQLGALIATTAPGTNAQIFRPGTAIRIGAGAVLTLQMHYTATGHAAADRTSVGFVFARQEPAQEIRVSQFVNGRFVIPPGAADHRVDSEIAFSEGVHVWGLLPHTHLRGKRWEYRLVHPDGRSEIILAVPKYDFNWQTYYLFAEPLAIPVGARIEASAWYDNSTANAANPDPTAEVRWGDQTWEEMQYTGLLYTVDSQRR